MMNESEKGKNKDDGWNWEGHEKGWLMKVRRAWKKMMNESEKGKNKGMNESEKGKNKGMNESEKGT